MIALAAMLLTTLLPPNTAGTALPQRKGDCRWVHGRMGVYNGGTPYRIWVIGTNRMVAVQEALYSPSFALPANLERAIERFRTSGDWRKNGKPIEFTAHADYRVCALIRDRPGHMLMARLTHARNILVLPYEPPRTSWR